MALDVARCFIRLGEPGEPAAVLAEWVAPGHEQLGDATRLPGVELAIREGRTLAVADLTDDVRLEEPGNEIRSLLVTPIVSSERAIGVLGVHGPEPRRWTSGDVLLAEAVAREAAGAIQTSRLLRESERRLAEQGALLKAGEALTSELKFDSVISRLVEELLGARRRGRSGLLDAVAGRRRARLPGRARACPRARSAGAFPSRGSSERRSPLARRC